MALQLQDSLPCRGPWQRAGSTDADAPVNASEPDELVRVLRSLELQITGSSSFPTSNPIIWQSLRQAEEQVLSVCKAVNGDLMSHYLSYAKENGIFFPMHEFRDSLGMRYLGTIPLREKCPKCGGRMECFSYRAGTWPSQTRRLLECERCAFLSDTEQNATPLWLTAPSVAIKGQPISLKIEGHNNSQVPAIVHAAAAAGFLAFTADHFRVTPEIQAALIPPRADYSFHFDIEFSSQLPTHLAYINGLALVNGIMAWTAAQIEMRVNDEDQCSVETTARHHLVG
jgi:hypothetical protein